ncbi:hypothetical protein BC938DRAFT_479782 [Jimgerdemannia flammicorona]|uniref:Uncharacterized protein n=1 Tax=Jimgerdemannia flammicorona TaxID=994334 RepID=A0A433QK51_9FUNG|nr:hypothetical protein BC938DRAFT_479782 [Jimgerdemannia flammicorona]
MARSNTQNDVAAGIKDALETLIHDSNTQDDETVRYFAISTDELTSLSLIPPSRTESAPNTSTYDFTDMKAKVNHKKVNCPAEVELANIMALVDKNYRKLISETVTLAKRCATSSKVIADTLELLADPKVFSEVLVRLDFYTDLVERLCKDAKEMHHTLEDIDKTNQNHKTNFTNQSVKFLISSKNLESESRSLTTGARTLEASKPYALGVGTVAAVAVGTGACNYPGGVSDLNVMTYIYFSTNIEVLSDVLKYRERFHVANVSSVLLYEIDETLKQIQFFWNEKAEEMEGIRQCFNNIRRSPVPKFDATSLQDSIASWRKLDDDYRNYLASNRNKLPKTETHLHNNSTVDCVVTVDMLENLWREAQNEREQGFSETATSIGSVYKSIIAERRPLAERR